MTLGSGAHNWIDEIAKIFVIDDGKGGQIRSYKMAQLRDLPPSITGKDTPCAIHYIRDCQPMYSAGGPTILMWEGRSDFHLFPDVKPANYTDALLFFPRILAAAMSHVKLHSKVNGFIIPAQSGAMRFVTYKNADGTDSHQGIEVTWTVKQDASGSYTVSA